MTTKATRFDLDWWTVSKRFIYTAIFLFALLLVGGGAGLYVWLYGNPFADEAAEAGTPAGARFISLEGGVRVVRADTREVVLARADTQLLPGDVVQTQEDGRARITLADGSNLFVKPNSVVTIAENTTGDDGRPTKVRVAVESGQINVRTEQRPPGASNIIGTQLSESRLAAETDASFHVRDDKSEAIRVASGTIETSTRNGDVATINNGEFVAINPQGSIAQREKLLAAPAPVTPRNLERIQARPNGAAAVALRWQKPSMGVPSHYSVEVATSPFFVPAGMLIKRDRLEANEFSAGDLRHGNYFWRVMAVTQSGQSSDWSEPQKFVVVSEGGTGEAIRLSNVAVEYVAGNIHIVRGRTQPGNIIRCAGRETLAGRDGSFQLQINAPPGAREITIDAADTQGNRNSFRFPLPGGGG